MAHSESLMTWVTMSCWSQWTLALLKDSPPHTQRWLYTNAVGALGTFDYILKEHLSKLHNENTQK